MRICFLAPAHGLHTKKWCEWFSRHGHEVHVISFTESIIENVTIHIVRNNVNGSYSERKKIEYLLRAKIVKRIIDDIEPDIISVHRASSYGMVAALTGRKNYVLSVWGEDVFAFPQKSILHKCLIKYSLSKAQYLLSTSKAMALEAGKYTKKKFEITPFGVDMELFSPQKRTRNMNIKNAFGISNYIASNVNDGFFVIGTIKSLSYVYGIDTLLKAVHVIKKKRYDIPLKVRIAGTGILEHDYQKMAEWLGISDIVEWLGFIPQEQAAVEWANMDLAIIPSRRESFGVSAVEAQACGIPLIISDVEGLKEATCVGKTSICFNVDDEADLANKIIKLYDDFDRREEMGYEARKFVSERFEINQCFKYIEQLFISFCGQKNN